MTYTIEAGRQLCRDGQPVVTLHRKDDFSPTDADALARRIPLALNAHDDLVAALRDCVEEICAWRKKHPHDHPEKPLVTSYVLDRARAALAKATAP